MAIRVDVKEYCADCFDFEPDVTKPERISARSTNSLFVISSFSQESKYPIRSNESGEPVLCHQTDTIVRCKYTKRCEGIKRYLEKRS